MQEFTLEMLDKAVQKALDETGIKPKICDDNGKGYYFAKVTMDPNFKELIALGKMICVERSFNGIVSTFWEYVNPVFPDRGYGFFINDWNELNN